MTAFVGPQEPILATVKQRNLVWFGHVTRPISTQSCRSLLSQTTLRKAQHAILSIK
ncbi:hypothetical protein DPMN_127735 [Dreissena polymorpha]|uniref:Uncharacterized protein n=1 Tax=Dreissena polymorpha TaxID=45954 RepID=A0A9D4GZS8_DREPO|nr:hypothetical protein DPMN_127735 [Dreissena polymorpha]